MMLKQKIQKNGTKLDIFSLNSDISVVDDAHDENLPALQTMSSTSRERDSLYQRFQARISPNTSLDRSLVSNQANKNLPFYNWFRYREGFSAPLIDYILKHVFKHTTPGILLDPFAGSGSALLVARNQGWQARGIELLPVGIYATRARLLVEKIEKERFSTIARKLVAKDFGEYYDPTYALKHVAITRGAFAQEAERQLTGYLAYCNKHVEDENIRSLLLYAAFCILEEISYTRKDGQYLRWDARSGRSQGEKPFNKGQIFSFHTALKNKLVQIIADLENEFMQQTLFTEKDDLEIPDSLPAPELYEGSCLEILPDMEKDSIDAIVTSPPYANRYDYTRTYALELVYLGCSDEKIKHLRQEMLSCTVENKSKRERLQIFYRELGREIDFEIIDKTFQKQAALQEVLTALRMYQEQRLLNNPSIVSLVHNYFYEMCFAVYEMARVLKPGGTIVMVNDNVRYAGEEVPVDLILADIAESFGLKVKHIWTLGRGKGNSSQQMGNHGRTELRKCVYVWEKDTAMAKMRDTLLAPDRD